MRSRRTCKAVTPYRSGLDRLVEAAANGLAAQGRPQVPAAPWLAVATVYIRTVQGCGWERDTLPAQVVERSLVARGWAWQWDGDELVIEVPGWAPPPVRVVAVQPGLFDEPTATAGTAGP